MLTADEIDAMREVTAQVLPDTITVVRAATPTFNSGTGLLETGSPTTIYAGPGRLAMPSNTEREVLFGEEQVTLTRFAVTLPHDADDVLIDDIVTLTSDDAVAADRSFRVIVVGAMSYNLNRTLGVEVVE